MSGFPTTLASELGDGDVEPKWLIEGLWSDAAVGVLGGEPKCCKSFLALDAAVSVASGRPCLRTFSVHRSGPVLVFPAEDSHAVVRRRLEAITAAAGMSLGDLPIHVITAPKLMLDSSRDRRRLDETVASIKPVLLVHHARKDARGTRPGQALRGSSDLHGWGDSNLYLRRTRAGVRLSIEHRAAPGRDGVALELADLDAGPALRVIGDDAASNDEAASRGAADRILAALSDADRPLRRGELKERCAMRAATFSEELRALVAAECVASTRDGRYHIPDDDGPASVPVPAL